MNKNVTITHDIQRYIITVLKAKHVALFRELRPSGVDTNNVSYHLKLLTNGGFIRKLDKGYTLDHNGLIYIDRINKDTPSHLQPTVVAMLLIQDSEGRILLQKHDTQPYINTWTLPQGEINNEDISINMAARRIGQEQLGLENPNIRRVGDCYVRVMTQQRILSVTFAHIFRYETDTVAMNESYIWVQPIKLHTYDLAPAIEQIIARSFFGDTYFFAEFEHDWKITTS
jgi:ADP-ribose pyrophosphatase YjhB (NUDIX family)